MYGNWVKACDGRYAPKEADMVDPSEVESQAMKACLKFFGEVAGEIGFDKPLGAYSHQEALQVIEAIVTGYTEAMCAHHERTKFPLVRGLPETADPMANPFADMTNDLP